MDFGYIIKMMSSLLVTCTVLLIQTIEAANLNEPCFYCSADNSICKNNLIGCSKGTCACSDGYRMTSPTTCKKLAYYQKSCDATTSVCRDINMECVANECACRTGYAYDNRNEKCIPTTTTHLGDTCSTVNNCYQQGSDANAIECAADFGTISPRICRCKVGYVQPRYSFICRKPHVSESCEMTVGCAPSNKALIDSSQVTEACVNGVCTCPLSGIQQRINVFGMDYNVCMLKFFGTLLKNGEVCTASNQCAGKLCYTCPGATGKYCVNYDNSAQSLVGNAGVRHILLLAALHVCGLL